MNGPISLEDRARIILENRARIVLMHQVTGVPEKSPPTDPSLKPIYDFLLAKEYLIHNGNNYIVTESGRKFAVKKQ